MADGRVDEYTALNTRTLNDPGTTADQRMMIEKNLAAVQIQRDVPDVSEQSSRLPAYLIGFNVCLVLAGAAVLYRRCAIHFRLTGGESNRGTAGC